MISITVYCDNEGIIMWIKSHAMATTLFLNQTIKDDFDVFNEIVNAFTAVPSIALSLHIS